MDIEEYLIFDKRKEKTESIERFEENENHFAVYYQGKTEPYRYNKANLSIYQNPTSLNPEETIISKGKKCLFKI